jgi:tRNA threonylcarbamoyladenosine biosynthesis protein TsaB
MMDRSLLLAIDTATRFAGLALFDGDMVLSEVYWQSQGNHSVEGMPALVRMLDRQGLGAPDLSVIGVATGPGSFTGLRIGLSMAKGLAQALGIPVVGVPTLDILAFQHEDQRRPIWAVIQAGRGRLCAARYELRRGAWRQRGGFELMTLDGLVARLVDRCLVCGELTHKEAVYVAEHAQGDPVFARPWQSMRRPACLAELAWQRFQQGQSDDVATLTPVYLHDPQP